MRLFLKFTEREELSKESNIPCYWLERLNVIKDFISIKKVSVKLIQLPSNPQLSFSWNSTSCVCVHIQRTKNNASEEKQGGGREILISRKIYYKGIQIKTARYGYRNRQKRWLGQPRDPPNRLIYIWKLGFITTGITHQQGKDELYNKWRLDSFSYRKMKLDPYSYHTWQSVPRGIKTKMCMV